MKTKSFALSCLLVLVSAGWLHAAESFILGSLFSNHAVLQRDMPAPVWGQAAPGIKVTVKFADQEKVATADKNGRWEVRLDPLAASSEGRTLTATAEGETKPLSRTDVLVGEVWICSGQSNMAWTLSSSDGGAEAIAAAGDGQLRLFAAAAKATDEPQALIGGEWAVDAPNAAQGFSGVAYFFGKELRKSLGVPVGLVRSAVGGTVAEAWTARGDLEANPTLVGLFDVQAKAVTDYPQSLASYKQKETELLAKWEADVAKAKADGKPEPRKPAAPQDPTKSPNRPCGLYNGSIAPLQPYAIRGAIWYQGESNSGRGKQYQTLFPAMIGSWRKAWGQGDFPFLFVQITPHNNMTPEVREAQRITTETTPNTAMAVTVDVGHPTDIHPRQKQPVGQRLALAARALAYGEQLEYSGPTYDTIRVDGGRAILSFKHLGGGLVAKGSELRGFTIAGTDGNFAPAKAMIDGDTIVVSSESVSSPVQVRYGWTNVPDINLFNQAGLPASPFQTDPVFVLEDGFELIFDGRDLSAWQAKEGLSLQGKVIESGSRFSARDGRIVVSPGKGLSAVWSKREFPRDFEMRLQFRAGVNADSGIFVRKPQLQCRDYLAAGPYKELKSYQPQDWNDIQVVVRGNVATCTCNGEPLKFTAELPATGPIGLEADRGQLEYRYIRVKEAR
ncbi:MAG: DUF1080 domain-containing protein [Planctomycetes bacterium]|nr:DUF1080 domain-containing protein [Planctomycetota bacterium]